MDYMLDTDTCIFIINAHSRMIEQAEPIDCGISVVVFAELERGNARSNRAEKNRIALDRFLNGIAIVDLDQDAAQHYADIRVHLETTGQPVGPNDFWIAAHARSLNVTLVTNNTREFAKVPDLTIDTWLI